MQALTPFRVRQSGTLAAQRVEYIRWHPCEEVLHRHWLSCLALPLFSMDHWAYGMCLCVSSESYGSQALS